MMMSDELVVQDAAKALVKRDEWMAEIDKSIDETTSTLIRQIKEDRDRAERVYNELLSLFNQGKNNPEDLEQLNKAQEMVQSTTDALQKVFSTLAKIKTGDAKVQIAQINAKDMVQETFSTADLIDMLEEAKENKVSQDNGIEVRYETDQSDITRK